MATAHVNAIGAATPPHDIHAAFCDYFGRQLARAKDRAVFQRMAQRSGIEHRYSFFEPLWEDGRVVADREGFYVPGLTRSTGERMRRFETLAPKLALQALSELPIEAERERITHLVVASCTGFVAPGLDQLIVEALGLPGDVERTVVGFMGCYAAVSALRLAHHFVRSDPEARVLVVNLELSTLHFRFSEDLARTLSMLLFADGCTAALVTAEAKGLALVDFRAATISDTAGAITWKVGDEGFDMHLSGEVPVRISRALAAERARNAPDGLLRGVPAEDFAHWAVHAGGRTILDAVESGFELGAHALHASRSVLREFGNMSSATLMFILKRLLSDGAGGDGFAVAFGPGLAAESFRFRLLDG